MVVLYYYVINNSSPKTKSVSCSSNHFEASTHPDMLIEPLFSLKMASKTDMHHS